MEPWLSRFASTSPTCATRPPAGGSAKGRRLDAARAELVDRARSISEIAHAAGYDSRNAFDRAFARRFGMTPGAARVAAR